jgi:hypothetical protein
MNSCEANVIRSLGVCSILLLGPAACGQQGLIEIVGVWPMDSEALGSANMSDSAFGGLGGNGVDTNQGLCAKEGGTSCTSEPFYAHFVIVRIANGYQIDANNPQYGVVTLSGFAVALTAIDTDAPTLQGPSGSVHEVINPEESRNIVLPLIDLDTKRDYVRAAANDYHRYTATYRLQFYDRGSLRVGTSIHLGPYNGCPSGTSSVSFCPTTAMP